MVLGPLVRVFAPLVVANVTFTLVGSVNIGLAVLLYFAFLALVPVMIVIEYRSIRDRVDQHIVGALVSVLHTTSHEQPVPVADPDPAPAPVSTGEDSQVIFDELAALHETAPTHPSFNPDGDYSQAASASVEDLSGSRVS